MQQLDRAGWVGPFASKLTTATGRGIHRVVTDAVHTVRISTSSLASTDRIEPGRISFRSCTPAGTLKYHPLAVSASATRSPISSFADRALSTVGVRATVCDFVHCAVLAWYPGYDGAEIMCSEGCLIIINQFLVARKNQRNNEYDGDGFANRMREIVRDTREACGPDYIIIFRLSLLDLVEGKNTWEEAKAPAQMLEDAGAGVTILHTGIGWHKVRLRE